MRSAFLSAALLALAVCGLPVCGQAGPGQADLTFAPATAGPLPCGSSATFEFVYTPGLGVPDLRGYSVTIRVDAGGVVSIGAGDFADLRPWGDPPAIDQFFDVQDNGDGSFTVSAAKLGGTTGLAVAAPLFAVTVHAVNHGGGALMASNVVLRDLANTEIPVGYLGYGTIAVDCWPPEAARALTATPLHGGVLVGWNDSPSPDVVAYEVWRGLWHDGAHNSVYPEYDDVTNKVPTRPTYFEPPNAAEWTLVGVYDAAAARPILDTVAPRGVYHYEVIARDLAGNRSLPALLNARATNYWLGDVEPYVDGYVEVADITVLGDAFGTADGDALYRPVVDVGPTDNSSRLGVPRTDSRIDFEDLMIFAMAFGFTAPRAEPAAGGGAPELSLAQLDDTTWVLSLAAPCPALQGLRVTATLPAGIAPALTAGELLARQDAPFFLRNIDARGFDTAFAVLGRGTAVAGAGELLRFTLPAGVAPEGLAVAARGTDNRPLKVALASGAPPPAALRLEAVAPNPFNPSTTIAFVTPAAGRVVLAVYALDGRRVATVVAGEVPAGRHAATWRGCDDAGREVPAGAYVCRLEACGSVLTRKMSLVK